MISYYKFSSYVIIIKFQFIEFQFQFDFIGL